MKFKVKRCAISHNGTEYPEGSEIELSAAEAAPLSHLLESVEKSGASNNVNTSGSGDTAAEKKAAKEKAAAEKKAAKAAAR